MNSESQALLAQICSPSGRAASAAAPATAPFTLAQVVAPRGPLPRPAEVAIRIDQSLLGETSETV